MLVCISEIHPDRLKNGRKLKASKAPRRIWQKTNRRDFGLAMYSSFKDSHTYSVLLNMNCDCLFSIKIGYGV